MAEVSLATATGIEGFSRHVVIKQMDARLSESPSFVQMFLDEARLAASLHHHNIVQVHDIGKEGGNYYFAMEYIHGEDLRTLLTTVKARKEKTPIEHAITIITAAASALHYAHGHCGPDRKPLGLVHRDVSPSNILITFDGNVKVVDFGIAKTAMATTETRAGDIKGKYSHMSPEQCLGKPLDRRSDVFALGIVLYELVTVRRLFKGDSDFAKMKAIVEGTIHRPSTYRPELSPELDEIILKALARDPAHRYQTADELRVALERFAIENHLRSSTTALADYMKKLFGERPEPWLVAESMPDAAFDAAVDAAVDAAAVDAAVGVAVEVDGADGKQRRKAITQGYADFIVVAESPPKPSDSSVSKTPMAWALVQEQPATATATAIATATPKRRLPWLAAALAGPLVMMGVVMARTSSDTSPAQVAPASAARATASMPDSEAVALAATPASSTGSRVAAGTHPGAVVPAATPTATTESSVTAATQPGIAAPAAAAATPDAAAAATPDATAVPTPDATATAAQDTTLLPATTVEPTTAKKRTDRRAKRAAKASRHAKQTAWDPDALTPE